METPEDKPQSERASEGRLQRRPDQFVDSFRPVAPNSDPVLHGKPSVRLPAKKSWLRWIPRVFGLLVLVLVAYGVFILVDVAHISTKPFQLSGLTTDQSGRVNVLVLGIGDP